MYRGLKNQDWKLYDVLVNPYLHTILFNTIIHLPLIYSEN